MNDMEALNIIIPIKKLDWLNNWRKRYSLWVPNWKR